MDWTEIALIVVLILLVLAGGYIKRLSKAIKELVNCFDEAIQLDSPQGEQITKEEWAEILERGKGIGRIIIEIAQLVALKKRG